MSLNDRNHCLIDNFDSFASNEIIDKLFRVVSCHVNELPEVRYSTHLSTSKLQLQEIQNNEKGKFILLSIFMYLNSIIISLCHIS